MLNIRYLMLGLLFLTSLISCEDQTIINNQTLPPPIANAGSSVTIQEPLSIVSLTGSGTTQNGYIVGYLWSQISGPNNPLIVSPSASTTEINNLILGNYLFQFAVIDSAGLTGVDTISVRVIPNSSTTITLQPSNSPTELVMVDTDPDYSSSNGPELLAEAWTSGGSIFNCRSLLKFDLSSIPANSTILSARLSIYSSPNPVNGNLIDANFGTQNAMYLSSVLAPWNSSTLFPNTPASNIATRMLIPHTNNSFEDIIDLDVTDLVQPMISNANYGFLMQLQTEVQYNSRIFASSYHPDPTKHPKLIISYQ